MTKLVIVTDEFPPKLGGVGAVMSAAVTELSLKQSVVLATFPHFLNALENRFSHVETLSIPNRYWKSLRGFNLFIFYLKLYFRYGKGQSILCSSWKLTPLSMFARLFGFTVFCYAQGTDISKAKNRGHTARILQRDKRIAMWIAASGYMKNCLLNLKIEAEKIEIVQNGVDTDQFKALGKQACKASLNMTSAIVFVSASRLDPIKGIDFALQVLGELKNTGFLDFHYYILGTGEKQYEAQLNQSIVDFGLTDHVTCVGFVSPKQLHTNGENMLNLYYSAADMFLSLNRALPDGTADASPMNVREAMAAKTVVFAGDSGGSTEIIQPNETGFTLNTNADYSKDIVVLILELINDSKRRNRIAENASAYIRNELTWKIQFGRLQTCIEEKASK